LKSNKDEFNASKMKKFVKKESDRKRTSETVVGNKLKMNRNLALKLLHRFNWVVAWKPVIVIFVVALDLKMHKTQLVSALLLDREHRNLVPHLVHKFLVFQKLYLNKIPLNKIPLNKIPPSHP